jgi:hypothetical protein
MKVYLRFVFIFTLSLFCGIVSAQQTAGKRVSNSKKIVTIPVTADSSAGKNFCICKIVSFSSDSYNQRTDAIFAGSTEEKPLAKKVLLKNIDYELQQAMLFFDSYKLLKQYAAASDCGSLYKYLKAEHEKISHFTVLLPSYVSR